MIWMVWWITCTNCFGRQITCSTGPVDHMLVDLTIICPMGLVVHILVDMVDDNSNSYRVSQVLLAWWSTIFFAFTGMVATFSFSLWMIILILQGPYPHSRYMVLSGVEIRKLSLSVSSLISIFGLAYISTENSSQSV